MPTVSLRAFPPPLRLDVEALARLHADGRLELLGPGFPPSGAVVLVLWRPGDRPAFQIHHARVERGFARPGVDAWVVAWGPSTGVFEEGARQPPS